MHSFTYAFDCTAGVGIRMRYSVHRGYMCLVSSTMLSEMPNGSIDSIEFSIWEKKCKRSQAQRNVWKRNHFRRIWRRICLQWLLIIVSNVVAWVLSCQRLTISAYTIYSNIWHIRIYNSNFERIRNINIFASLLCWDYHTSNLIVFSCDRATRFVPTIYIVHTWHIVERNMFSLAAVRSSHCAIWNGLSIIPCAFRSASDVVI